MTALASLPARPLLLHPGAGVEATDALGGDARQGGRLTAACRTLRTGMATVRMGTVLAQGEIVRVGGQAAVRDGARVWVGEQVR